MVSDIILEFMKLSIDWFTISYHEFVEGRGGESFDSSVIEAIFILECCPQFFSTLILKINVNRLSESALRIL